MSSENISSENTSGTKTKVKFVEVDETRAGQRVDNFLMREVKNVPKTLIYRWLRKGEVRINKGRAKPTTKLNVGDVVRIPPMQQFDDKDSAQVKPTKPPSKMLNALLAGIVYEDDTVIVLDKPSGIAAHGGTGIPFGVIETLRTVRPAGLELVHRLDRQTSGLMLLSKNRDALLHLQGQLQAGDTDKRYLTLVKGRWEGKEEVEVALSRVRADDFSESAMVADEEGKASISTFKALTHYIAESEGAAQKDLPELNCEFTAMEVAIKTGRMHQIRVHAAHSDHPLAGDRKYGDSATNDWLKKIGLKRLFLHAHSLGFRHPVTNEWQNFNVPLSNDLKTVLDGLEPID